MDYKSSGVDVEAGYKAVELFKNSVRSTFRPEVISDIGGFGGMFSISSAKDMAEPVLVSGTDGVGTKLKIAFMMDKHDTVGIDCVAMSVNDIICCGAQPLFFLDYIACGKNVPEKISTIVSGIAEGCKMAGVALIGGETAEMPGFYPVNEYDLAGFAVGLVDKEKLITGGRIQNGDIILGLKSNGLHSNGFSLVRKIVRPSESGLNEFIHMLNATLGEELLIPTRIYVKPVLELIKQVDVLGIANITGGGFIENIPRIIPDGLKPVIDTTKWEAPLIFSFLQKNGNVETQAMFNTFNMGIGMVIVVRPNDAEKAVKLLNSLGETACEIGHIAEGDGIEIC